MNKRHVPALDGVRGLAILLVMFHHFTILTPRTFIEQQLLNASELGRYGVDLFFVLSGYLITGILLESRDKPSYFSDFYRRRVLRIFPLYYALLLAAFIILPAAARFFPENMRHFMPQAGFENTWGWYAAFCSNFLLFIQNKYSHNFLDISWSLAIEEHFYLVWPAIVYFTRDKIKLRNICLVIVAAALVLRAYAWHAGYSRLQIYVLTFTRMDTLAFGALIAICRDAGFFEALRRQAMKAFLILGAALFLFGLAGQLDYTSAFMNTAAYTLIGVFFAVIVVLALPEGNRAAAAFFESPFLRLLGKYSYALYMFNLPVRGFLSLALFKDEKIQALQGGSALLWQFLFYVLTVAVSLALAWVSWTILESPFLSLKTRLTAPEKR